MSSQQSSLQTRQSLKVTSILAGIGTVLFAAILFTTSLPTQISGVVNVYQEASYIADRQIVLTDASAFAADDRIIVMQMKGATISTADDATYGDILEFGEAGNYELATVRRVSGDTLFLTLSLCNTYDVAHKVQVIRVASHEEIQVTGTVTGLAWDGSKGGVVAIEATQSLELQATIDVSEIGFRGGDRNGTARTGGLTYICDFNSGQGGIKGEGIVEIPWAACRGKLANGGGGANDHNGGGGGGSGYGAGGTGGHGWKSHNVSDTDKGGRGGLSLQPYYDAGLPKLFLGGGGGGGHQNNGASYPAGNGGGIVILISPTLIVTGNQAILANGADAQDHTINDGASGGGGGGSILLDVDNIVSPAQLTLHASGGDGATLRTQQQHGPGGGGGGGMINTTSPLPQAVQVELSGGDAGLFLSSQGNTNPYHNTPHGAEAGQAGAVINNLFLPVCSTPPTLDLNGAAAGTDYQHEFLPGSPPIAITDSTLSDIQDLDDIQMEQMVVSLTNPLDSSLESLSIDMDSTALAGMGLNSHLSSDQHELTVTGEAFLGDYLTALGHVQYQNQALDPDRTDRIIHITVDDGGALSNTAQSHIAFSSVNFPVEWLGIEAAWEQGQVVLSWQTAMEQNNHYFEIERVGTRGDFSSVGRVEGVGTTSNVSSYQFADMSVTQSQAPTLTYRIKQVDLDGTHSYSQSVQVGQQTGLGQWMLNLYPNPASDQAYVRISGAQSDHVSVSLMTLSGRRVQQREQDLMGGAGQVALDVSGLSPGTYLVQVRDRVGMQTLKLSVRR